MRTGDPLGSPEYTDVPHAEAGKAMAATKAIAELNRQFGIPGVVEVVEGNGGLAKVRVNHPTAAGEMYLHGAHVTSWKPAGTEEVLFVSRRSRWEDSRAIRGGVPICFPWFGAKGDDANAPAHGFVRTKPWSLESIMQKGNTVTVSMFTESDAKTKQWWAADFRLTHRATFGAELALELTLTNRGSSALRCEEALHTYHRLGSIERARVRGLETVRYLDKTDGNGEKTQQGEIAITAETDRVYLDTEGAVELEDPVLQRRTRVAKGNSRTTVVWNPWNEKTQTISDMEPDEWRQMICIETSNVCGCAIELGAGQQHSMKAIVGIADL
jgi:glucose-6-phosphate 1-epimerase